MSLLQFIILIFSVKKFRQTGSIKDKKHTGRKVSVLTEQNLNVATEFFKQSPHSSLARASAELGFTKSSVQKMLKKIDFKPFHPTIVQELKEDDPVLR